MKKKSFKRLGALVLVAVLMMTVIPFTTAFAAASVNFTDLTEGQILQAGDQITNNTAAIVALQGNSHSFARTELPANGGSMTLPSTHERYKVQSKTSTEALFDPPSNIYLRAYEEEGTATVSATSAFAGEVIKLTATPKAGFRFLEWMVSSGGITIENNQFTMGDDAVNVQAVFEWVSEPDPTPTPTPAPTPGPLPGPTEYSFKTGADGIWARGGSQAIFFSIDANWDNFVAVKINGQEVGSSAYELDPTSGTIGLKPMYLDSLANGTYELTVVFTDGAATTTFVVKEVQTSPKTGDTSDMMFYGMLVLVCAGAVVGAVVLQKKLKRTEK